MLAKIKGRRGARNTIDYHERKERIGMAQCLAAENFAKDKHALSFEDKVYHFERLGSLNEGIHQNMLHISVNFHPMDKLTDQEMVRIAGKYLEGLKLDDRPYLVYRHFDSFHPHMHIVTTPLQDDGRQLNLSRRDLYRSHALSGSIEKEYQLVESGQWKQHQQIGNAQKVRHGELGTMTGINNVLEKVIPLYKYTSMEELNAVLKLYNIEAYEGREGSKLREHHGLLYRVLDEDGSPRSTHIKASLFDSKPTLARLEQRFVLNEGEAQRQQDRQRVTATLEWNMVRKGMDLPMFEKELQRQRVSIVWKGGNVFFVDHETKAVFDGSRLGERYGAAALRSRFVSTVTEENKEVQKHHERHHHSITREL